MKYGAVELSGSNYEIGYQHGELLKPQIHSLIEMLMHRISCESSSDRDFITKSIKKYIPYIESTAPHILSEIKGIADGSESNLPDVMFLNLRHEILNGLLEVGDECTSFGIAPNRSSTGKLIIAQNVDQPKEFSGLMQTVKIKPDSGPTILMHILPGNVGQHGINSYGLIRASNGLKSKDESVYGVPRVILNRLILEQKDVESAISLISSSSRTVSSNYLLGDTYGNLLSIESTAHEIKILSPKEGILVHANNFLDSDIRQLDTNRSKDSPKRYDRALELINGNIGKVGIKTVKTWLRDHINYPESVCNHTGTQTISSIIYLSAEQKMEIAAGNPCSQDYLDYYL